jgi:hypothetical protein
MVALSENTRKVLRFMLSRCTDTFTAAGLAREAALAPQATTQILARLAGYGWISAEINHGPPSLRPYVFTGDGVDAARDALREVSRRTVPVQQGRVWTVGELEDAVANGEQPAILLEAVRESLALPPPRRGRRPTITGPSV